ncbi:MAG: DUF2125 domain-containing protein [Kordiimonadaceae bacterium]|nr:DUF2125 domain-containing protein [Kordiimonadaceae bacterium]
MINQLKALAGILFLVILAYGGIWYTIAFQAEKDVTKRLSIWRDSGIRVEHGSIEHGGFPYRITVTIKNLSVATRARGLSLEAKNIELISHVWTPRHWLADASGLIVSAAGGSTTFGSTTLLASYRNHDDGTSIIAFESGASTGFTLTRFIGQPASAPESWKFFLRSSGDEAEQQSGLYAKRFLDFKLEAKTGPKNLSVMGGISGPRISDWTKPQLKNWSYEGGLLELDTFVLRSTNAFLKGNGSLTLDEQFRPLGSASLTVQDGKDMTRILSMGGLQTNMPLPGRGPISLTLQNGVASMEGAQLFSLKSIIQ